MHLPLPITREIVLIGGGHTHALFLKMWGMAPLPGARVTVIDPGGVVAYSGMLPGFVAGHYSIEDLQIDLVKLARFAGARVITARAEAIDLQAKCIRVSTDRPDIAYDVASIDIGITSDMPEIIGFSRHATAAKPLEPFARRWKMFTRASQGTARSVAVIGGGVAGIELAMAMKHGLMANGSALARVTVIDRSTALQDIADGSRKLLLRTADKMGVDVIEGGRVLAVSPHSVRLEDGRDIPADLTVGAAGARAYGWLEHTGLDLHEGFVTVGPTLQSSNPAVFACGDCAHLSHAPRPKAGVFAVREAPVLFDNMRALLTGRKMRAYYPQRDYLKLVSLGGKRAMADRTGLRMAGAALWRWKDRIDRRFMEKLTQLDPMQMPPLPALHAAGMDAVLSTRKPLCGGCGSKVAPGALRAVLQGLDPVQRADVLTHNGDDAGVLQIGGTAQVLSIDHLRAMVEDPYTMARIATVHALGDVWAMGATPQAALASVILPPLSDALQRDWLAEVMAGIGSVLRPEGMALIGGHSTIGHELTIGLTVTGLCATPITLAGARAGDALILTKPLGTGVIMAADMALRARAEWVEAAIASMTRPQGPAAEVLADAHAMTDVTGFGLAAHLDAICAASGVGAELVMDAIPMLPGAELLASLGISSTLMPANRKAVALADALTGTARENLLFDPQTAGGLLAAVAPETVPDILRNLMKFGLQGAEIGRILPKDAGIRLLRR